MRLVVFNEIKICVDLADSVPWADTGRQQRAVAATLAESGHDPVGYAAAEVIAGTNRVVAQTLDELGHLVRQNRAFCVSICCRAVRGPCRGCRHRVIIHWHQHDDHCLWLKRKILLPTQLTVVFKVVQWVVIPTFVASGDTAFHCTENRRAALLMASPACFSFSNWYCSSTTAD